MAGGFFTPGAIWKALSHEVNKVNYYKRRIGKKKRVVGTSLVLQWLRLSSSTAEGVSLTPGRGTKVLHAQHNKKSKEKKVGILHEDQNK